MKREEKEKNTTHRMRNIAMAKNNKLNKLYVSADIAGAHINPVETHEIIYEPSWQRERERTCHDFSAIFMKNRRVAYMALPI